MCSSSVTELSLSHAGLRQDYKRWTAMCSKSSYLPSLEGMPCKIWLAARSVPSIDFEGPLLLARLSVAVLSVTCWLQHVPDPGPAPRLLRRAPAARAAHQGIWPGAERSNRSQAAPALLLRQMGEAWHSILRQMPPPYSTCLELGHGTEWTVCLIIKETKSAFMQLSGAPALRRMHGNNCWW